MDHFVQGVLTLEDKAYIGEPDIRLANGETIRVLYSDLRADAGEMDEENPVSLLLEEQKWYELLLVIQIGLGNRTVTYSPTLPPGKTLALASPGIAGANKNIRVSCIVQGIILDLNWNAASQDYLGVAGPVVYTHHFVLIETAIGKAVLSAKALQQHLGKQTEALIPGGYLEWEPARHDLLAVIARRDSESEA